MQVTIEYKSPFIEHESMRWTLEAKDFMEAEEKFLRMGVAPKEDIIQLYTFRN